MTSKELNLKLTEFFPEIKDLYIEETSWQDGDETGSHVVYEDVLVPFLKKLITDKCEESVSRAFVFIEKILELEDEYANEVIAFSVLESLIFDDETDNSFFVKFAKPKTVELIKEIMDN